MGTKKNNSKHDLEHKHYSRRSFIQALGIGGAGSMLLGGNMLRASTVSPLAVALNKADSDRILILIRLQGGNDGLNTIVPVLQYDTYANYRPNIYHKENNLIKLNDSFSMPKYMEPLEQLWGDGAMKVVNGVGYEDNSLSHFTSSDLWASSSRQDVYTEGFLGRHFTETYPDYLINPPLAPLAIQIGSIGNLIFDDDDISYSFLVSNPNELQSIAENGTQFNMNAIDKTCHAGAQKEFLRQQSNATYAYSEVIHDAYSKATNAVEYEDNSLAKQLAIVARLIKGNLGTKVFMVTLNGFDTHSDQESRHETLMGDLSLSVKNFFEDLKTTGHDENVLGMTFSEFGRRVTENGSEGTDHGAASTTLFFGPSLQGNGFVGEYPDLNDLDKNGNLKYKTDFRGLYATVLAQWMCLDVGQIQTALESNPEPLNLGFECTSTEPTDPVDPNPVDPADPLLPEAQLPTTFAHQPYYDSEHGLCIKVQSPKASHVDIQLYSIIGQHVGTLYNSFVKEGTTDVIVKDNFDIAKITKGQ